MPGRATLQSRQRQINGSCLNQPPPGLDAQDVNNAVVPYGNQLIEHVHDNTHVIWHDSQNVSDIRSVVAF